ncbi:MAG: sigma-54 dependent transcriptional regulator [Paramuribaculum sp.]|nr:sigma-54 dependent transcriptional regulator [Paramuribaculum sp.]
MSNIGKILVIDDNRGILTALRLLLKSRGFEVETFRDPAIVPLTELAVASAVLLDMNFKSVVTNGNEGLFWLNRFKNVAPQTPVILMTAFAEINLAVKGIKEGAVDFIVKPWDNERLIKTIEAIVVGIKKKADTSSFTGSMIWGNSPQMKHLLDTVSKVSPTNANVLILGENGTGKGLLAQEIHRRSKRSSKEMHSIDVGSIPDTLFESELFGYVKGAFTGATSTRQGKIEDASGSTLFLDEITNLPIHLQIKLLSVLQNRTLTRLGNNKLIPVDIRLICATNGNISEMVKNGSFREDLYYRINTIVLNLLPLRERQEDIPELVKAFIKEFGEEYDKPEVSIDDAAMDKILRYSFPGNIRELRHLIEQAVILSEEGLIKARDISIDASKETVDISHSGTIAEMEKKMIKAAMVECGGNLSEVASRLGITRQTLYNKIKRMGL